MTKITNLNTEVESNWCPGCGNFGVWNALKQAIVGQNLDPDKIALVSGIGCSSQINQWINTYGFQSLHGRLLPAATGIKLCNHELTVIAVGGDGDGYGIGMGHFIHAMRRNLDMTYIVTNNQVYGLTQGQTSPTSMKGHKSKSTPFGAIEIPVNPLELALSSGATYISRGYAGDLPHLTNLISDGIAHKGFSFIDVLQPCVTFNKINTYQYFQQRCYKLEDEKHDAADKHAAYIRAGEAWDSKIPIGLFYEEERPTYESEEGALKAGPLAGQSLEGINIERIMRRFM
ncbi:MAG: thiamine pyrophosphate-dependent enzyme [Patescibacteria group bacterium]|nr:2-oxoacid ferredoxin oxidoreductase [Patescibacteria group bacterium]